MPTTDPRVDAYVAKAPAFAKPILTRFRKAVHTGCPNVTETLKWSVPFFEYKGTLASMAAFKAHIRLGFWKGSLLTSSPKGHAKDGPVQFGSVTSIDELPGEATLVKMVREAAALNDAGVKVTRAPKAAKPVLNAPAYMLAAIRKNKKAHKTYAAFSPSARREYVEWVTGAKSEATRDRRLETTVQWLSEGKIRNWKYVR